MIRDKSAIILYHDSIASLLPDVDATTNAMLDVLVGWIVFREMYWFIKGVESHSTTVEHMRSPEAAAAFLSGYAKAKEGA